MMAKMAKQSNGTFKHGFRLKLLKIAKKRKQINKDFTRTTF